MPFRRTSIDSDQRTGFYSPKRSRVVGSRIAYSISPDPDAEAYLLAVEAADGEALEAGVVNVVTDFVVGCKSDGIWDAIKASCILAGARTLAGALVPLVGTAPTNNNFVSGDYNRKTGLKGDGNTKYLDTNRNNNADPQNSKHYSVFMSQPNSFANQYPRILTAGGSAGNDCHFVGSVAAVNALVMSVNNTGAQSIPATGTSTGFMGASRSSSSSYVQRSLNASTTITAASGPPSNVNFGLFTVIGSTGNRGDSRIAFYSIGESLDLALLDNRVTRLINEIAFFLNTGLDGGGYDIDTLKYVNAGYAAGGSLS